MKLNPLATVAVLACVLPSISPGLEGPTPDTLGHTPDPSPIPWASRPKGGIPAPRSVMWVKWGDGERNRTKAERRARRRARRQRGKR